MLTTGLQSASVWIIQWLEGATQAVRLPQNALIRTLWKITPFPSVDKAQADLQKVGE